jgi:adenylyl- and sulfurtransferase ThiI
MLAPVLEQQTNRLLATEEFTKGNLTQRRAMLKKVMRDAKKQIKERMEKGYGGGESVHLRMVAKANSKYNKEIRNEAAKAMKETFGIEGSLEDYSFAELDLFMEYADYLNDMYQEAASF